MNEVKKYKLEEWQKEEQHKECRRKAEMKVMEENGKTEKKLDSKRN